MTATPFANIAITTALILVVLLVGGIILIVTGNNDPGNNLISVAIGALAGSAATTGVVHSANAAETPAPPTVP